MPRRQILLPLDGSELAARAVPWAARFARHQTATIVLLYARPQLVINTRHPEVELIARAESSQRQHAALRQMQSVSNDLRAQGISANVVSRRGPAAKAIVDVARARDVDLLVMSTHGQGGATRALFGSVADAVCRAASTPMLLVPGRGTSLSPSGDPLCVLVALDGSALAEQALCAAAAWSATVPFAMILVRVVNSLHTPEWEAARRYLTDTQTSMSEQGRPVRTRLEVGDPVTAIARVAWEESADIVAMGTHGRGGLQRLILGSVASDTLQVTTRPLLLCPRGASAESRSTQSSGEAAPSAAVS